VTHASSKLHEGVVTVQALSGAQIGGHNPGYCVLASKVEDS
jgi:hypothetical protein